MRDMAHSIFLIKLYQITMRKKFRFFVSDYLKPLQKNLNCNFEGCFEGFFWEKWLPFSKNFPETLKNTKIRILDPKKYDEHTYHFTMEVPPPPPPGESAEDELVKGQFLVLCLTGQALSAVEQLEEEKESQEKFPDLKKARRCLSNQCRYGN